MRRRLPALLLRPRTWAVPYVALWFAVGLLPIQPTDMDLFFWPSARVAVHGQPLLVYTINGQALYPNANGPVALLPLTLVGLVMNALGRLDSIPDRRPLALAVFSVFLLLMTREALGAIERLRGRPLDRYARILAAAVIALGPPVWQSLAGYGHIEQGIEIWMVLLAARWLDAKRPVRAGAAYALAILSRSPSLMLAAPLGLAAWHDSFRSAVKFSAATAVTGLAVLAPFVLADPSDVIHSLFTYRRGLEVGAGSVWALTHGGPLEPVVQRWDLVAVGLVVVAINVWLATRPGGLTPLRLFAGMSLSAAAFTMLTKTVWPYYFMEFFIFGTIWSWGRWRARDGVVQLVLLPVATATYGLLAEVGAAPDLQPRLVSLEGGAMFAMLVLTGAWILWLAGRATPSDAGMRANAAPLQGA